MKIEGIKYVAPCLDNSGYAQASRGNILALHKIGVPLTVSPISFEKVRPSLGETGELLKTLINKKIKYNVVIVHSTPEFWEKYTEKGKINIGYTIWETTKLHDDWPDYINDNVDKVLVGCEWNKSVFRESGVTIPIGVVPHTMDISKYEKVSAFDVEGIEEDDFVFYDIMQWTERKNPVALLKAYWYAFQNQEKVALVLKTYRSDYSDLEKNAIRISIQNLKHVTPFKEYPKIYFVSHMLTESEILGLHKRGDCFVSLDRGEGFGLSGFTAGANGNPIIVTGFGGATEYAKKDNSYLVKYQLTPVSGMPWSSSPIISVSCVDINKLIKDVVVGDLVFNKNGKLKRVLKVGDRPLLDGEYMHSIAHYSMPTPIEVTNRHKLHIVRGNKIVIEEVKNITDEDYLIVPKPALYTQDFSINMLDYAVDAKWVENNNRVVYRRDVDKSEGIYKTITMSEKLFYLIGLYLAEGCVYQANGCVSFSFNLNEVDTLVKKCKDCISSVFGISSDHFYERVRKDRAGYELVVNNILIGRFFKNEFGTGSHDKYIPYRWRLNKNINYRQQLLKGYWDGDGHIRKKGIRGGRDNQAPECLAETASKQLFLSLRELLISIDIIPSTRLSVRNDGRITYVFSVSNPVFDVLFNIDANRKSSKNYKFKVDDDHFAVRVKSNEVMENYNGVVYSISVEPDETETVEEGGSYILNGIASSNSPWYRGNQLWAEPDVRHGAELMRHVYNNREEAKEKGARLKKYISEKFNYEYIGKKIIEEIEKI